MRLSFFRQPSSKSIPAKIALDLEGVRAKILTRTLISFLVVGFGVLFVSMPGSIQKNEWGVSLVLILVILWLVVIASIPKLTFRVKAGSLIAAGILVGCICLVTDGLFGSGLIFLLVIPLITSLLFGAQRSFLVFLIAVVLFCIIVFLMESGIIQYPSWTFSLDDPNLDTWLISGFSLALFGAAIIFSLFSVMSGLETSIEKEKRLIENFDIERSKKEHLALQNTQDSERRLEKIRSALDISYAMGRDLALDQLLHQVVNLIKERFHYYYVGVYLLDEQKEFAVLKAGTGEAGSAMIEAGHQLAVNDASVVGWVIQHQQAKIALDVGFEAVHFNNPLLSLTRSELVLPLIVNDGDKKLLDGAYQSLDLDGHRVLGAMTIQSTDAKAFDQEGIKILQEVAEALATAMGNAILFHQIGKNLAESQKLHHQYLQDAWKEVVREGGDHAFSYRSRQTFSAESGKAKAGSEVSFPVKLRDQEIGQLILELEDPELKDDEKIFIETVTNQAAVALENVRLMEKNQRQAGYERQLSEISRKVTSSTDLDTILQITLREIGQVMKASDGMIQLKIPTGEKEAPL